MKILEKYEWRKWEKGYWQKKKENGNKDREGGDMWIKKDSKRRINNKWKVNMNEKRKRDINMK